jgi:hypothetical protein
MIWITGLNRGLVRRKCPRELGSGNMDSKRVSSVASELEEIRRSVSDLILSKRTVLIISSSWVDQKLTS